MQLLIGFVNDVHGYLEPHSELFYKGGEETIQMAGGYARIATIFKKIQKKIPILCTLMEVIPFMVHYH